MRTSKTYSANKGFAIPLIILVAFLVLATAVVLEKGKYSKNDSNPSSLEQENTQLKKQVDEKEEEILALIADRAQLTKSFETPYTFREFGVWSSLLDGKQVEVFEYKYKRAMIRSKEVRVKGEAGQPGNTFIKIWEFERRKTKKDFDPQFFVFDGYESFGKARSIDEYRLENCSNKHTSKNATPINYCSTGVWSIKNYESTTDLYSFQASSPTNNAMLIRIGQLVGGLSESQFNEAKKNLFTIADQIYLYPIK